MTHMRMQPKTLALIGVITLSGAIAAGCGSGAPPKKSASSTSTTTSVPQTTTSSPTTTSTSVATTGSTTASIGPCASSHLSASIGSPQGTAGTFYYPLTFTNTGRTTCTLKGYPGVSLVGSSGNQIGLPATRTTTSSPSLVSLTPGGTTTATIGLTDANNVCSNPVTPNGFRVYPPNQTAALYAPYAGLKYCVGNANDAMTISPIGSSD